jgi:hypothetical protein
MITTGVMLAQLRAHHRRATILPAVGFRGSIARALGRLMCITMAALPLGGAPGTALAQMYNSSCR